MSTVDNFITKDNFENFHQVTNYKIGMSLRFLICLNHDGKWPSHKSYGSLITNIDESRLCSRCGRYCFSFIQYLRRIIPSNIPQGLTCYYRCSVFWNIRWETFQQSLRSTVGVSSGLVLKRYRFFPSTCSSTFSSTCCFSVIY